MARLGSSILLGAAVAMGGCPRRAPPPPPIDASAIVDGARVADAAPSVDAAGARSANFQTAVRAHAAAATTFIAALWSAPLEEARGEAARSLVALTCPRSSHGTGAYLIEDSDGTRVALPFGVAGSTGACAAAAPSVEPGWQDRNERFIVHEQGSGRGTDETHLALREHHAAILWRRLEVSEEAAAFDGSEGHDDTLVEDWERLTARRQRVEWGTSRTIFDGDAAIVPVLRAADSYVPPTHNVVVRGRAAWRDEFDANLQLRATREGAQVHLRLAVTDDVRVPARTIDELLDCDHLELWWCVDRATLATPPVAPGGTRDTSDAWIDPSSTSHPPSCLRGLALGALADGTPVARWILAPAEPNPPLPSVSGGGETLELTLSSALLGATAYRGGWAAHFTAAFVDHDGRAGYKTVATSRLDRRRPSSLGLLVSLPGDARYPAPPGATTW